MYVVAAFEDCPVCGERIECTEVDDRSEWCRSQYYCLECDHTFEKYVQFKIQSDEIESEEWQGLPEDDPAYEKDQTVEFMWEGNEERGRIYKRHVNDDGTYHYHIDCPSLTSMKPLDIEYEFAESELH